MKKSLSIMLWNANGLQKSKKELEIILKLRNIDICLISETHFTKESYFKIDNYTTYHTIHPANCARGGSAILIKDNIKHYEKCKISCDEFQTTTLNINTNIGILNVTALYSPPRHSIKENQYRNLFQNIGEKFIIGGDLNAKHSHWGSRLITPKGRELYKAAQNYDCEFISTGKPTYWPTDTGKTPDLIDFFITRKVSEQYLKVEEGFELNSDHSPIYLTLSNSVIEKECPPFLTNKNTDWNYFKNILNVDYEITEINNTELLENEVIKLTNDIQNASWQSTPVSKKRLPGKNYPSESRNLIKEKRILRKDWQQTRDPAKKTELNRLGKFINNAIKELENASLNKYLSELTNNKNTDYSLWKATKGIKRPIEQNCPIKMANNEWARNNSQKVNIFSEHLVKTFSPVEQCSSELPSIEYKDTEVEIAETNINEIKSIMKELNAKKAPGFDLITAEIIKQLPHKTIFRLTKIINACINLKYFPSYWKVAEVIMISKPGKDPHEVSSYRPISLLPILSKILEKIIIKRLRPVIDTEEIIPSHQFGFREKHSTIDQVHRITDIIENAYNDKKVCSAVFLDVSQAFDKVWHEGLIFKLKSQLPKSFCKFLESYLSNRYFRVKYDDEYSSLNEIKAGVPQGSILGPTLYLLYTSDLPTDGNYITATFADDTALLAIDNSTKESTEKLQLAVNKMSAWTKKWGIKLNNSKSIHVDFTNMQTDYKKVYIDDIEVPHSNCAKYLGMTLDAKLRWKEHVKKKKQELDLKYSKMYWLIGRNSKLSTYNKLLIYKQVLKPVWTYGIQLWGCASETNIAIIQRFQNKALRTIANAPWYVRNDDLHRDLQIDKVKIVIQQYAKSHSERLRLHTNEEASNLYSRINNERRLNRVLPSDLAQ